MCEDSGDPGGPQSCKTQRPNSCCKAGVRTLGCCVVGDAGQKEVRLQGKEMRRLLRLCVSGRRQTLYPVISMSGFWFNLSHCISTI